MAVIRKFVDLSGRRGLQDKADIGWAFMFGEGAA